MYRVYAVKTTRFEPMTFDVGDPETAREKYIQAEAPDTGSSVEYIIEEVTGGDINGETN